MPVLGVGSVPVLGVGSAPVLGRLVSICWVLSCSVMPAFLNLVPAAASGCGRPVGRGPCASTGGVVFRSGHGGIEAGQGSKWVVGTSLQR